MRLHKGPQLVRTQCKMRMASNHHLTLGVGELVVFPVEESLRFDRRVLLGRGQVRAARMDVES